VLVIVIELPVLLDYDYEHEYESAPLPQDFFRRWRKIPCEKICEADIGTQWR